MRYSVLLPTRNGGQFLRNCIESILSQEYDDFELVISDNANSDATPAIVAEYRTHPKVRAIRLDEPVSVTDNWNAAYRASSTPEAPGRQPPPGSPWFLASWEI